MNLQSSVGKITHDDMKNKIGRPLKSDYFTVGQVAIKLGWTIGAVNYWIKQGLIPFRQEKEGDNRQFRRSDVEALRKDIESGKWEKRIAEHKKQRPKSPGRPSKKPLISGFQVVLAPDDESSWSADDLKVVGIKAFDIYDYNEDYDSSKIPDWHHEDLVRHTFAPGDPFYERAFALHERERIRLRSPEKTKDLEPEYDPFAE